MPRTDVGVLDFAFRAVSSAEGLMELALEANKRAHRAEQAGKEDQKYHWYNQKITAICLAVLAHREAIKIKPCGEMLSVSYRGERSIRLHVPRRVAASHVRSNGYDQTAKASLLRAFGIDLRRSERRPEDRLRSRSKKYRR